MAPILTIGQLRAAIANLPDNRSVVLEVRSVAQGSSWTGAMEQEYWVPFILNDLETRSVIAEFES